MATKKSEFVDITKSGYQNYSDLQDQNSLDNNESVDWLSSFTKGISQVAPVASTHDPYQHQEMDLDTGADWGSSAYDEATANENDFSRLNDKRAENQSGVMQLINGLTKGVLLAGTTFLDGTIGLLAGGAEAIRRGEWSGLWDNDFSKAMQSINDWSEQAMPNYYSQEEQEREWYKNIGTANFWGDKFIKNLGFTVGAFYSGNLYAGAGRAATKAITKGIAKQAFGAGKTISEVKKAVGTAQKVSNMTNGAIGSFISAVNEGRIEALNNSRDWYNAQLAPLQDEHDAKIEALMQEYELTGDPMVAQQIDDERELWGKTLARLDDDRKKMGNVDLALNIPILTVGNAIQFGKMYANGFRTGRRASNIVKGMDGKYAAGTTKGKAVARALLNPLAEGNEEISQKAAQTIAGDYYAPDINMFYKSGGDEEAAKETLDWWKATAQGLNETWNDGSSWEEFFIGTLTGALGMPRFRSMTNSETGKRQSPVVLEGGIFGELRDANQKIKQEQALADAMNERVQGDMAGYYKGLTRHNVMQKIMDKAVEDGNEKEFKDAEHAQFISDIVMFDNANRLDDLVGIINESMSDEWSQEELENIAKNTTSVTSAQDQMASDVQTLNELIETSEQLMNDPDTTEEERSELMDAIQYLNNKTSSISNYSDKYVGPWVDDKGNAMYSTPEGKQKMIDKLKKTKSDMLDQINQYMEIKMDLVESLPESVTDDQISELIYMQSQINDWDKRGTEIVGGLKKALQYNSAVLQNQLDLLKSIPEDQRTAKEKEVIDKLEKGVRQNDFLLSMTDENLYHSFTASDEKAQKGLQMLKDGLSEVTVNSPGLEAAGINSDEVNKSIDDLIKIGSSRRAMREKLDEYRKNPSQQAADHARIDRSNEIRQQETDRLARNKKIRGLSPSELNAGLADGSITQEEIDAFKNEAEDEDLANINEMENISDKTNRAQDALANLLNQGAISQEVYDDATAMLNASSNMADSADSVLDTDNEYFNDETNLPQSAIPVTPDIQAARVDAVKNLMQQVKEVLDKDDEIASRLPGTSEGTNNQGPAPQTGHDSVDRNQPVNRQTPEQKQKSAREQFITNAMSALGIYEAEDARKSEVVDILNSLEILKSQGATKGEMEDFLGKYDTSTLGVSNDQLKALAGLMGAPQERASNDFSTLKDGDTILFKGEDKGHKFASFKDGKLMVYMPGSTMPTQANPALFSIASTPEVVESQESEEVDNTFIPSTDEIEGSIDNLNRSNTQGFTSRAELQDEQDTGIPIQRTSKNAEGKYDYWKPTTTRHKIHRQRGDNAPYHESMPDTTPEQKAQKDRVQKTHEFMVNSGAFDRVDGDQVKAGDKVRFAISRELTNSIGVPKILMIDKNGNIIGDLPVPQDGSTFNDMVGFADFYNGAVQHYNNSAPIDGQDLVIIPNAESTVSRMMIGKPQFTATNDRRSLNEISQQTTSTGTQQGNFKLGVALEGGSNARIAMLPGRSKSQGIDESESAILSPLDAQSGQPFLLMPTSRKTRRGSTVYMTVPFTMPVFDMSNPKVANSKLGQAVVNQVSKLKTMGTDAGAIKTWKDGMRELIYTPELHINFDDKGNVKIAMGEGAGRVSIYSGSREALDINTVLGALANNPFNISRKYINSQYMGQSYNTMIGELAETNLPVGATHTVDDWFTINPIVNGAQQKAKSPKSTRQNPNASPNNASTKKGTSSYTFNGKQYTLTPNGLIELGPNGRQTLVPAGQNNEARAYGVGLNNNEPMNQPYNTDWGMFDPVKGKFVNTQSRTDFNNLQQGQPLLFNGQNKGHKFHHYSNGRLWITMGNSEKPIEADPSKFTVSNNKPVQPVSNNTNQSQGTVTQAPVRQMSGPVRDQIAEAASHIQFDEATHTYTVDGRQADMSVTEWTNKEKPEPEQGGVLGFLEVSSRLGTEDDRIKRAYFAGEDYVSPLLTEAQNRQAREEAAKLKQDLDNTFGEGQYSVLTDENLLRLAGTIRTPDGVKTIAGTMDMLLMDKDGNLWVIDFKTKRSGFDTRTGKTTQRDLSPEDFTKYSTQVSIYGQMLNLSVPLANSKVKGGYLAITNLFYNTPKGSRANERGADTYTLENGQIMVTDMNGHKVPLYQHSNFGAPTYFKMRKIAPNHEDMRRIGRRPNAISNQGPQVQRQETPNPTMNEIINQLMSEIGSSLNLDRLKRGMEDPSSLLEKEDPEGYVISELLRLLNRVKENRAEIRRRSQEFAGMRDLDQINAAPSASSSTAIKSINRLLSQYYAYQKYKNRSQAAKESPWFTAGSDAVSYKTEVTAPEGVNHDNQYLWTTEDGKDVLYKYYTDGKATRIVFNLPVPENLRAAITTEWKKEKPNYVELGGFVKSVILDGLDAIANNQPVVQQEQPQEVGDAQQVEQARKTLKEYGVMGNPVAKAMVDKMDVVTISQLAAMPKVQAVRVFNAMKAKFKPNMKATDMQALFNDAKGRTFNREVREQMANDKKWSMDKELRKLKRVLPQLSDQERLRIVNGLIDEKAWGQFYNGVVTLSNVAARGTSYHEAFHFVSQSLLTERELRRLYKDAAREYGDLDDVELEERLAESFREFMQDYEDSNIFKKTFKTLKHIIKNLLGKETVINKLFQDIRRGRLATRQVNKSGSAYLNRDESFTQEMEGILEIAPRDKNGRLLAPNGVPSNLTERQYVQVRTQAFKEWFGDWENNPEGSSKVVDANGEPLVVYHDGSYGIEVFEGDEYGLTYFGDPITASSYGYTEYPVFLNIRNPRIIEGNGEEIGEATEKQTGLRRVSPTDAFDGVIYRNVKDIGDGIYELDPDMVDKFWSDYEAQGYGTVYSVADKNKIKSATDNNGEFSRDTNNIYYRLVGQRGVSSVDARRDSFLHSLSMAKVMESEGRTPEEIKWATGWERGVDEKWRLERPDFKIKQDQLDVTLKDGKAKVRLTDIFDDKELFAMYPEFKDGYIIFDTEESRRSRSANGWAIFMMGENNIGINTKFLHQEGFSQVELDKMAERIDKLIADNKDMVEEFKTLDTQSEIDEFIKANPKMAEILELDDQISDMNKLRRVSDNSKATIDLNSIKEVLGHELQHLIQSREDWTSGDASGRSNEEQDRYWRNAGEVEARNVARRMNLTWVERLQSLASSTEDVNRDAQRFASRSWDNLQSWQKQKLYDLGWDKVSYDSATPLERDTAIDLLSVKDELLPANRQQAIPNKSKDYQRKLEQYHRDKLMYGKLNDEQKNYIAERGITIEEYNEMTPQEKETLFFCMA